MINNYNLSLLLEGAEVFRQIESRVTIEILNTISNIRAHPGIRIKYISSIATAQYRSSCQACEITGDASCKQCPIITDIDAECRQMDSLWGKLYQMILSCNLNGVKLCCIRFQYAYLNAAVTLLEKQLPGDQL